MQYSSDTSWYLEPATWTAYDTVGRVEVPGGLERFEGPAQHDDGVDQIVPERRMQVRHPARMVCVSLPLCMSLCMSFCMLMVCSTSHIPTHTDACLAELHALSI